MELFWNYDKWNYEITTKGNDNHRKIVTKVYRTIDMSLTSLLSYRQTNVDGQRAFTRLMTLKTQVPG